MAVSPVAGAGARVLRSGHQMVVAGAWRAGGRFLSGYPITERVRPSEVRGWT